jgi:hypothetical protein
MAGPAVKLWKPASYEADSPTKGSRPGDPEWRVVVKRVHGYWRDNDLRWQMLMDSLLGGKRYRDAYYGIDRAGLPVRNLIRHKREYPDPQQYNATQWGFPGFYPGMALGGADLALGMQGMDSPFGPFPGFPGADPHATAQDDDYEYRRSRTPVPPFVQEAAGIHLGTIYDQEIHREGPDGLVAWWKDVDGRGTPMDDWMRQRVAPLLLTLGCIDICLDRPRPLPGQSVVSRYDEQRLKLDRCVASYILPQNVFWWRLDAAGRYREVLIREFVDPSERVDYDEDGETIDPNYRGKDKARAEAARSWMRSYMRWRYWTEQESVLLDFDGSTILDRTPHSYRCVPIVRIIDEPDFHAENIGRSRYEAIADLQRHYYNTASELVLSNSLQAHPFLSGPEDWCKADNTVSVGPARILPMKKLADGKGYQGWVFVSAPKDAAESLRKDLQDIIDQKDRVAGLSKPAGAVASHGGAGHGATVTGQSGVSKQMDAVAGHKILRSESKSLATCERTLAEYAMVVLRGGPLAPDDPARAAIKVVYPSKFELRAIAEMAQNTLLFQQILSLAGDAPEIEGATLKAIVRMHVPDLDDDEYAAFDAEIDAVMDAKGRAKEQYRSLAAAGGASAPARPSRASSRAASEAPPPHPTRSLGRPGACPAPPTRNLSCH